MEVGYRQQKLTPEQVRRLFEQIESQMDRALFLLMLRCGLRVSEVAHLKVADIDWEQQAIWVEQGKGRKDRVVYLSADALATLKECQAQRPRVVAGDYFFWNQKRRERPTISEGDSEEDRVLRQNGRD